MIAYFETSAIVKLLLPEEGSLRARSIFDRAVVRVTSRATYPEGRAALAAARRARRLGSTAHDGAARQLRWFAEHADSVELTREVSLAAGELAESLGLRGYDAIHLASAATLPRDAVLVTWDGALSAAARSLGLATAGATAV